MVPMPRLFMQRGAALPIRIRVIRYLGSQPVQRRMNMTDSYDHNPQLEEEAAPAKGKPLSDHSFKLGDRVMDLIKDHGDFKAEVNKSIGELSTKMANGFADVHREFADVRREIGDVRREIGDVKHTVGLLRWQLGIMVTVLTGFFGFAGWTTKKVVDAYFPMALAKVEKVIDKENVETVRGAENADINDKQKSN